ncbi:ferrous iron transport protein B [Chlamydiota bacterium]
MSMSLQEAQSGKEYVIVSIKGGEGIRNRLTAMGFVPSCACKVMSHGGGAGPVSVFIKGSKVAIGKGMADNILVREVPKIKKEYCIALAGNPNSGKTTIFNNLTGKQQHVGNYPGVTVEKKEGTCAFQNFKLNIVDLPGTYSLTAYSIEEIIARNFILEEKPDLVVDIIDFSSLERSLYLAVQLMELHIPLVLLFNKKDIANAQGLRIDIEQLSSLIGIPIVTSIGHKKVGIQELLKTVTDVLEKRITLTQASINYGAELEEEIAKLEALLTEEKPIVEKYDRRWFAIKLLENDTQVFSYAKDNAYDFTNLTEHVEKSITHLKSIFRDPPETVIADRRYGFISGACSESFLKTVTKRHDMSDQIDRILTNHIVGIPIFLGLVWMVFQFTFVFGKIPQQWIHTGLSLIKICCERIITNELGKSFIVDGVIAGVGTVLLFLPNILFLFLAIAFLEDSGYMARVAFIMDRVMHKIGLHGKSFIPMILGFGCTVPAYMASRILEEKEDRLITMHVSTFMSCGARLPVYILICGAFWPHMAGNIIFLLYLFGIFVAMFSAKLLRKVRFKGVSAPFVIELPPYRMPTLKAIFIHMWKRCWLYLRKAGTVIFGLSIVMWLLVTFPKPSTYNKNYSLIEKQINEKFKNGAISLDQRDILKRQYKGQRALENLHYSYAGKIGKGIEPVIKPLGFDWRLGIGIFAGVAAKEAIISTLGTIYNIGENEDTFVFIRDKLQKDPLYSPLVAFSFLIFILLYIPCMPALIVFMSETKSFKEILFQIGYTFSIAWFLAFVVYQGGKLLGFG